jgi:alginate O-acetyltransferase complex protein AlgI
LTILQIFILAAAALIAGRAGRARPLSLLAVSAFTVFWLQPQEPFVSLVFWLPFMTLAVTSLAWALTATPEVRGWSQNWPAFAILFAVPILFDLNRYFKLEAVFMSSTPVIPLALAAGLLVGAAAGLFARWGRLQPALRGLALAVIILIFVILKTPQLSALVIQTAASLHGQNVQGAGPGLSWLGFSYLAFRILHTLRDRQTGVLPQVGLAEYVNYVIFFPAFTAGPIDRLERFVKELRAPLPLDDAGWIEAGTRLFVGLFKKFVLSGLLGVISMRDLWVTQVHGAGWMWLFLYAYSFQIYFDFSGYTDVAIGLGRLAGIRLPENFAAPYLKPNLTQFWNAWHITLTQWFRAYFFNPLTRALRRADQLPVAVMVFLTQLGTMLLIGLWHGITPNFALWGAWHGLGLFIHNRWSDFVRPRLPAWTQGPRARMALNALGIFLTFHYVTIGWLFFTLSSPALAWLAIRKLLGLA